MSDGDTRALTVHIQRGTDRNEVISFLFYLLLFLHLLLLFFFLLFHLLFLILYSLYSVIWSSVTVVLVAPIANSGMKTAVLLCMSVWLPPPASLSINVSEMSPSLSLFLPLILPLLLPSISYCSTHQSISTCLMAGHSRCVHCTDLWIPDRGNHPGGLTDTEKPQAKTGDVE